MSALNTGCSGFRGGNGTWRSLLALGVLTLPLAVLFSPEARAADLLPCPEGATETDITDDFSDTDDGYYLLDVGTDVFPNRISFADESWDQLYINTNGTLTFGAATTVFTPEAITQILKAVRS